LRLGEISSFLRVVAIASQSDLFSVSTYDFIQPEQDAATIDRRRSDRVAQCLPAWISGESVERGSHGRHIMVNDLSMHGIGFADPAQRYRPGATHWLVVNSTVRLSTRVKIVSCRESPAGGYEIGAAFF
jgi:hypothetical protein